MTTSILVSWISYNHDPYERGKDGNYVERAGQRTQGPTLEMLLNPDSPLCGRVQIIYVLARRPPQPERGGRLVHPREEDVVAELQRVVRDLAPHVVVKPCWFGENAAPTDHRAIFLFTAQTLREIRRAHPRAQIAVNLSPGTPAMHAALLLCLQARLAGENVRAYQGAPPDKRQTAADVARPVQWNLLAELAAALPPSPDSLGRGGEWTHDRARTPQLREVAARVQRFGAVPFPVLIVGARGTGKTVIARQLRDRFREVSVKAAGQDWDFHLNCAEFSGGGDPNMLRSALFGHEQGAYSNAGKAKPGLLERAADDCVFLDEIHRMDSHAQGMLLLALQRNGTFRRLGGDKATSAKFRLLAATNVTLSQLRNDLNEDFLDRISDLIIHVPELRECAADLGEIWNSVVRRACTEVFARDEKRADQLVGEFQPHRDVIERELSALRLPGNFRDLEKLARRLLVASLASDPFVPSIQRTHVGQELERLRQDEQGNRDLARSGRSLEQELPTRASCEAYLRTANESGTSIDGHALVELWEHRLLDAAHAVAKSGVKAAGLLRMHPRTFTDKRKNKPEPTGR